MTGPEGAVHVVSVADDPALAAYRQLKDATQRAAGNFIVESERVLQRMIELGVTIESVLVTPSRWGRIAATGRGARRSVDAPIALLLGSEPDGLREPTLAPVSRRVRIPIADHVDSLNVATAAAITMFSLFR